MHFGSDFDTLSQISSKDEVHVKFNKRTHKHFIMVEEDFWINLQFFMQKVFSFLLSVSYHRINPESL